MIKKLRGKLILLFGLMVCAVALIFCIQFAYGSGVNSESSDNTSESVYNNEAKVGSDNQQSQSNKALEKKDKSQRLSLDPDEQACENQRKSQTVFNAEEVEGDDDDTYHVRCKSDGIANFNVLKITRGKNNFDISYDYRGFFGNKPGEPWRRANVQYFYNSWTKELKLICFDGCSYDFKTYGYGLIFCGNTVFEDNIDYDDHTSKDIAEEATSIYLDPKITGIKEWGLQYFKRLERVDILGKMHEESNLSKIYDHSLRYCGQENSKSDHSVDMDIFDCPKLYAHDYLNKTKDWAAETNVVYHQPLCGSVQAAGRSDLEFYNIDDLKNIIENYYKEIPQIDVNFCRDMNFYGKTINIPKGMNAKFNLGGHKLYSAYGDKNSLIETRGNLSIISGNVQEVNSSDSTIVVKEDGKIKSQSVNYLMPRDTKDTIPSQGGFFYFDDISKESEFNDCTFSGCADSDGGAVYLNSQARDDCWICFTNCKFNGCHADDNGGAVCNDAKQTSLKFAYTTFKDCYSGSKGGAVATTNDNEDARFDYCIIEGCHCDGRGGAIYNDSKTSNYSFWDSTIKNCYSFSDGGAIASINDNEHYKFYYTVIDSCSSTNDSGGAIYVRSSHSSFIGNQCREGEKSKYTTYGQLNNCSTIINCKSYWDGGGICFSESTSCGNYNVVKNLNFINNYARSLGGAIHNCAKGNELENCLFRENHIKWSGYHDFVSSSAILYTYVFLLKNCEFDHNYVTEYHGRDKAFIGPNMSGHYSTKYTPFPAGSGNNRLYLLDDEPDETCCNEPIDKVRVYTEHKLSGTCRIEDDLGKPSALANQKVEILDENDKVIATTTTDTFGHYEISLRKSTKVKVRICCPRSVEGVITSQIMDMSTDHIFDVIFRDKNFMALKPKV